MQLTSTTAPGKIFSSRSELADHYKSDWHKYNLKRREMNMTMLTYEAFNARLEAALALKKEREMMDERSGKDHLKKDKKKSKKKDKKKSGSSSSSNHSNGDGERKLSKRQLRQEERKGIISAPNNENTIQEEDLETMDETPSNNVQEEKEDEPPVIDPKQCLFDNHISESVQENIEYMYNKYGFFIPDVEYLVDKEGLIGYCAEKIKLGHTCLYCQKMFTTWTGCQKHMIQCRHTKLKYEAGVDLEEFDVFYDFTAADVDFLNSGIGNYKKKKNWGLEDVQSKLESMEIADDEEEDEINDDDSGEWEDIDSDEEEVEDDDEGGNDNGLYAAYQNEIAQHGLDITPLGELIFPDGRIIGHRGLSRYYKQRITLEDSRTAVVAARRANGERLYEGRVYDTYGGANGGSSSLELARAGISAGLVQGRQGKGILVPLNGGVGNGRTSYTALSLYRYKASVKKARKEEFKARRLEQRTSLPMNKMDKKGNRLQNNVSVAHAPR